MKTRGWPTEITHQMKLLTLLYYDLPQSTQSVWEFDIVCHHDLDISMM